MSSEGIRYLITGGAGFIGYHVCQKLIDSGAHVWSIDSITNYYEPTLKRDRLALLSKSNRFSQHQVSIEDIDALSTVFESARPDVVIHLAAQAGVRYSLNSPRSYINTNVIGTFNVMEQVRQHRPRHFLMASTSSVYGANQAIPFDENHRADLPMTIYAATKKSAEAMTHSYAHLWNLPTTMMRFFTVYGPWGRPDMALFKMTEKLFAGEEIDVHGDGEMYRDFTFIDDLVRWHRIASSMLAVVRRFA
jgi:UDP-glucuronate 4-epimerase